MLRSCIAVYGAKYFRTIEELKPINASAWGRADAGRASRTPQGFCWANVSFVPKITPSTLLNIQIGAVNVPIPAMVPIKRRDQRA